jgi:hypothetical protein
MSIHHHCVTAITILLSASAHAQTCNFALTTKAFSPAASENENFGLDGSVSGDFAAISAGRTLSFFDTEPVYIFRRIEGQWVHDDTISIEQPNSNAFFGASVSLSGNRLAISASGEDDDTHGEETGAVYLYAFDGNNWVLQERIIANDAAPMDRFGNYLMLDGDTLIVGADGGTTNGFNTGALYVFEHDGSSWNQTAKLEPPNIGSGNSMWGPASRTGDIILAGDLNATNQTGASTGAVYEFRKVNNTWTYHTKITPTASNSGALFGQSIDIDGNTTVIGAFGDNANGSFAGAAHVFELQGTDWVETHKLTPSDTNPLEGFGQSVAIEDNSIFICSEVIISQDYGSVYLFQNTDGTWAESDKLASPVNALTGFASRISVSDSTVLIPAAYDFDAGNAAGAAYFYDLHCDSPCLPDVNNDGMVTPADFSAWVAAFNAQAPECDQNGDSTCSPADFSAWVANFNAGC